MIHTGDPASTDAELVDAARAGDRMAMEQLLARHYDRIHAITRRITANAADADDAAQETLIKIVRSLDGFDHRSSVSTWIHRIATNTALDEIRRRSRRPALSAVADPGSQIERIDEHSTIEIEGFADQAILDGAIAELPDDQRAALVLRDAIGLDYQEIAEVLDIAPGTVKSRISRARQRLMANLKDQLVTGASSPDDTPDVTSEVTSAVTSGNQTGPGGRLSTSPNDERSDDGHTSTGHPDERDTGSGAQMRADNDET